MTKEEMLAKHQEMIRQESGSACKVWLISQAVADSPEASRACYVIARGPASAIAVAHQFGLYVNDSEAHINQVDYGSLLELKDMFKLLTREEVREAEKRAFSKIRKIYVATVD